MRSFIAIELPSSVKEALQALAARLRPAGGKASWVKPENMHLTLRFLGDVDDVGLNRLGEELGPAYAGTGPMTLRVSGTGAFPNVRRPGVIWAGIGPLDEGLGSVQEAAEAAARRIGLRPDDKRFHPHVTLARIRDRRGVEPLMAALEQEADFDAGAFEVGRVVLFGSTLTRKGPIYTPLKEFVL